LPFLEHIIQFGSSEQVSTRIGQATRAVRAAAPPIQKKSAKVKQNTIEDAQQKLAASETYDFEYTPHAPGRLRLEVANAGLNSKVVQSIEVQ